MIREVYLDNSATTRPFNEIIDNVSEIISRDFGNPSSLHNKGLESESIQKESRKIIADSLGVSSGEIFFTSGGTESNNIALQGWLKANAKRAGTLITSKIEHPSVIEVFKHFEKTDNKVCFLPVDANGVIIIENLEKILKASEVSLLSIMHVNNEVGSLQPIEELIKLKKQYGFTLHIDAVQSYCKEDIYKHAKNIDLLSFSGHKIHALKGIGALYIKKGTKINPVYYGGGQENCLRPGTENIPGIWSVGKAVTINESGRYKKKEEIRGLKDYFANKILDEITCSGQNGTLERNQSAPHILNIWFQGVPGEVMLHALEEKGIFVSTGSACSSRKSTISHVLDSMGIELERAKASVRFSLSVMTDKDEIDYTVEAIKECIKMLRRDK